MKAIDDYREIIRSELSLRFRRNPNYSLRAFARYLQLNPARLSEMLNRKSGISLRTALKICSKLGFSISETEHFCNLVEAEHARSATARVQAANRVKQRNAEQLRKNPLYKHGRELTFDSFRVIEDWYHLAILQYLKIDHAESDISVIARYFNISEHESRDAINRMLRLNLLVEENGHWKVVDDWVMTSSKVPNSSIRKFHEQIIDRAAKSLHLENIARRSMRSVVFAVNVQKMPEIESRMREFAESLVSEYTSKGRNSEVSALSIQFFPLSKQKKEVNA